MITYFSSRTFRKTAAFLVIGGFTAVLCVFAQEKAKTVTAPAAVYPVERYESLWKSSLFGKTTSKTAAATSSEWNLAGVFEIEGKKGAILMNTRTGAVEKVTLDAPNSSGIQLVTVQPGGKGAPPRVEISQNGSSQWVTARKIQQPASVVPQAPNRAIVNSRAGTPVPRREDAKSKPQATNLAPPSPLDVPADDVVLPDPTSNE